MRAAVIGGTGSVGGLVVRELARRGDEVRVLSRTAPPEVAVGRDDAPTGASRRTTGAGAPLSAGAVTHHPVDLRTGAGLDAALDGVDVVLDLANATKRPEELLVGGSRRALQAGVAAGVGHHVLVSIVGCDRVPIGYYRVKTAQERVVADGPVPWSILRATQFHTLVAGLFESTARFGVRPRVRAPLQPIDPVVVASRLADAAHAGPSGRLPDLGGPRRELVADLADAWSRATGRGRIPVRIPSVGPAGKALRAGALCADGGAAGGPDRDGAGSVGATFAGWLAADRSEGSR